MARAVAPRHGRDCVIGPVMTSPDRRWPLSARTEQRDAFGGGRGAQRAVQCGERHAEPDRDREVRQIEAATASEDRSVSSTSSA
jgi:hypothetical protein